jgi:hypothetical protein
MSLVSRVIQRLKRDYFRSQYQKTIRDVLSTAPLQQGDLKFTLLSMVQKRDVSSYLVAVKSFAHFLNPTQIVVVCDPSLDQEDRAILKRHLPHVVLREAHEFTHPDIPRGGTWERLYAIAGYVEDSYVIQLDADTLTVHPVPEVMDAIHAGRGFVLAEVADAPVRSLQATHENALPWISEPRPHIQAFAEVEMINVGLPKDARYIRGCSGFTGFPRSTGMREQMTDYSRRMTAKLGEDWKRWGTEQVTSNYLVSNAAGTRPLPFPKYGTPDHSTAETAFYHFIGPLRFINSQYETTSRRAIQLINSAAT